MNNKNYDDKITDDMKNWKDKKERKAKVVIRDIRRTLKTEFKDDYGIYIPYGRLYYEYDTECGDICGSEESYYDDCSKCKYNTVWSIEIDAIVDLWIKDKTYMIVSESHYKKQYVDDDVYEYIDFDNAYIVDMETKRRILEVKNKKRNELLRQLINAIKSDLN